jgi:hypothetical protein
LIPQLNSEGAKAQRLKTKEWLAFHQSRKQIHLAGEPDSRLDLPFPDCFFASSRLGCSNPNADDGRKSRPDGSRWSKLGAPPLHSTSRTRVAEKRLNPMEVVWNAYGIGMESVWRIRPASPEQRASNTKATRWRNMPFATCKPMAYDLLRLIRANSPPGDLPLPAPRQNQRNFEVSTPTDFPTAITQHNPD